MSVKHLFKTLNDFPLELDSGNGGESRLECPRCGSGDMHHHGVIVYDREEDAKQTLETRVKEGFVQTIAIASEESMNPSLRRDGIAIVFSCENCGGNAPPFDVIHLTFAQHKGSTHLQWRFTSPRGR